MEAMKEMKIDILKKRVDQRRAKADKKKEERDQTERRIEAEDKWTRKQKQT